MTIQGKWRTVGVASLVLGGITAWYGVSGIGFVGVSVWFLLAYWSVFLVLLVVAFLMALLDLRYIRLLYALENRRIYQETLGSEAFREALRKAHQERGAAGGAGNSSDAQN